MMYDVLWKVFSETTLSRHEVDHDIGWTLEKLPEPIAETALRLNLRPKEVADAVVAAGLKALKEMEG